MQSDLRREFTIRFSEIDYWGHLRAGTILYIMQDLAGEHYNYLCSLLPNYEYIIKNYGWMIRRSSIKIIKYPSWNEKIIVYGWRYPHKNVYDLWEFIITDKEGVEIIKGECSSILMNIIRKQPVLLNHVLPEMFMNGPKKINDNYRKISELEKYNYEMTFPVYYDDLDFNKHVNSSVYIKWAFETVPQYTFMNYKPHEIDISYIKEIPFGKNIISQAQIIGSDHAPEYLHRIATLDEKKEVVIHKRNPMKQAKAAAKSQRRRIDFM